MDIVGKENVETTDYARVKYSTGSTMEEILMLRKSKTNEINDIVVHPKNKEDVSEIVKYCNEQKIPIFPYSAGSSVTLGMQPVKKGGISLVMGTHMNRFIKLNEKNQTVTVEPGLMGPAFEELLNNAPEKLSAERRYTCGHFPQSFEFSTVGGWILALGSGQQSSYYGDMSDIVISQEFVTPAGNFKTLDYPSTATGPKINDIMKGSEGAFGILVSLTVKVFRYMPKNRNKFSFIFPTWESAVNATREISQGEFGTPSVLRISDPEETDIALKLYGIEGTIFDKLIALKGFKSGKRCLCLGHTEGEKTFSRNVKKRIKKICKKHKAMYLTGYPVSQWQHGRFADPYMREDMQDYGIMIDTLESGVSWDNLHHVHESVRKYIKNRPDTVCMTHSSHFYPQGTNLYWIFFAKMNDINEFKTFQRGIIKEIQKAGGSLSHHHGVGKMIGPFMEKHLGKEQMDILRAIKKHIDPENIMNPGGTLGFD